jgi:hypothetical protein
MPVPGQSAGTPAPLDDYPSQFHRSVVYSSAFPSNWRESKSAIHWPGIRIRAALAGCAIGQYDFGWVVKPILIQCKFTVNYGTHPTARSCQILLHLIGLI